MPTVAAEVAAAPLTCRDAIQRYWPVSVQQQAFHILDAENGTEAPNRTGYNTNGTTDNGCMQINTVHLGEYGWSNANFGDIDTAAFNVQVALQIYNQQGWCPWSTAYPLGYCQ